jgi:hypothetical protein
MCNVKAGGRIKSDLRLIPQVSEIKEPDKIMNPIAHGSKPMLVSASRLCLTGNTTDWSSII